jgi:hypothetical protein
MTTQLQILDLIKSILLVDVGSACKSCTKIIVDDSIFVCRVLTCVEPLVVLQQIVSPPVVNQGLVLNFTTNGSRFLFTNGN